MKLRIMRKLILFSLISFASFFAYSQEKTIVLVVTDSESELPISGANVLVNEIQMVFGTDVNGELKVLVPNYGYNVTISFVGYETKSIFIGDRPRVKVGLVSSGIDLDEVIISSTRADNNIKSTDIGKDVLNLESIRDLPPLAGEIDIIKSIVLLPGVSTVGEASAGLNVRGGGFDQNLILLGGGILYNPSHLFGFFSSILPEVVDNITLYKGVVPARFGGRSSSVVDISYRVGDYQKWGGDVGIGMVSSKLAVSGPVIKDKLALTLGGRLSYVDWLIASANNTGISNSSANFGDLSAKLDFSLNLNNQISYSFYRSNDQFNLASDTINRWSNLSHVFNWKHYFGDKLSLDFTATNNLYNFDILNETGVNDFELNSEVADQSAKVDINYELNDNNKFNVGVEARYYQINPGTFKLDGNSEEETVQIENEQGIEYSAFLYNTNTISEKIEVSYGVRLTRYNYLGSQSVINYQDFLPRSAASIIDTTFYGNNEVVNSFDRLEPRFGIRYSLNPTTSIKAGYNRMNQFVQLVSNTATLSPVNVWKLSNSYTPPQQATQYSLGLFKNFKDNSYESSIEVYYKDIQDVVEYKDGAQLILNNNIETELLTGKGKAYGVELFFKKQTGKWTGWASYTFSRSLRLVEGAFFETSVNNGEWYPSNYDKPHDFTLVTSRKTGRFSKFSAIFTYSTGRPVTYPSAKFKYFGEEIAYFNSRNESRIPDYHRLDVSFTFKVPSKAKILNGDWTIGIYNVYGRANAYSVFFDDIPGSAPGAYKLAILDTQVPSLSYNIKF